MRRVLKLVIAVIAMWLPAATGAFTHAFLDHAIPSVGGTVSGSPSTIRLFFTQGVVTAFSHVHIVSESGAAIPAGKPINDPSDRSIVIIRLGRALPPGTYSVSWYVVSVDTHTTEGTFSFTVS